MLTYGVDNNCISFELDETVEYEAHHASLLRT
jgi:hypothetical protein